MTKQDCQLLPGKIIGLNWLKAFVDIKKCDHLEALSISNKNS